MKVIDHNELFNQKDYIDQFEKKKEFEIPVTEEEVEKVKEWTKTKEYQEINFKREALTINPSKACQPLGAVLCALGFEKTLPFVHGSQGCVAYFRSHFSRHFKEPIPAVSSSMTEDAAVFGGLSNMIEGLENANAIYKPKMIAISTTCMAEVIGDDLNAFIKKSREKNPELNDVIISFAHTPSFVGSHIIGYDNMLKGIISQVKGEKKEKKNRVNIIPGFETYTGNIREIKRIFELMGADYIVLSDSSDVLDSPNYGVYNLYPGGTKLEDLTDCINSVATISLQKNCSIKTGEYIKSSFEQEFIAGPYPIGIKNTDTLLEKISQITGKPIPEELQAERGRAVDAMIDSHPYIHGKHFALYGDPDLLLGLISFLMELGGMPIHIVCTNADKAFEEEAYSLLASSPFGQKGKVYIGKDMWHLRSLLFTEPVDYLIGNSYGKFLWRDTGTPLIRIGFPLFDRHHLHRYPIIGYQGAINLLNWIVNTILDELDRKSMNTTSFDVIR